MRVQIKYQVIKVSHKGDQVVGDPVDTEGIITQRILKADSFAGDPVYYVRKVFIGKS